MTERPKLVSVPILVECPTCGAQPGEKCVTRNGSPALKVHQQRSVAQMEENTRRVGQFVDTLDLRSFVAVVAQAKHDWMCSRERGNNPTCGCLCVLAQQMLDKYPDTDITAVAA